MSVEKSILWFWYTCKPLPCLVHVLGFLVLDNCGNYVGADGHCYIDTGYTIFISLLSHNWGYCSRSDNGEIGLQNGPKLRIQIFRASQVKELPAIPIPYESHFLNMCERGSCALWPLVSYYNLWLLLVVELMPYSSFVGMRSKV